jgi:hypothetical protein
LHLRPLQERLLVRLKERPRLFADETTAPVLDPGRGCTKTASFGPTPPTTGHGAAVIHWASFTSNAPYRKSERPITHLEGFKGILQVDGYAGYRKLADRGKIHLAFCWSHVRRAGSMSSPSLVRHRSPAKRSNVLPGSTPSRKISGAEVPRSAERFDP